MKIRGRNIPILELPGKVVTHIKYKKESKAADKSSAFDMLHYEPRNKVSGNEVIRVAFIAQMPEVWDKQMDLFRYLLDDPRFDPDIIYVKQYDFVSKSVSASGSNEIAFYTALYGKDRVIDYFEQSDLDLTKYDYLFYDRPYNHYLPEKLQTYQTRKTNRICLVNYCCRDGAGGFGYRDFARDTYIWFASTRPEYETHLADYTDRPFNKVFDVGYPAFETYHALVTKEGQNRILWTPRWTLDESIGGSHFFTYIDAFIQFAKRHADMTLTIRPHPLMFDNLIEQKKITPAEVEEIKSRCADAGIRFDQNRIVADTFTETDILITDYSSLIKMFMVMGKPVLYCPTDVAVNEEFQELMQSMYLTYSWEEIEQTLKDLTSGKDDLKDTRDAMVSEILLRKKNTVAAIADILSADYRDNRG